MIFSSTTRTNPEPKRNGESVFEFYDRVKGPFWDQVRDLIEAWHSSLCATAQREVLGRIQSKNDRQFRSAFFELYIHQCLIAMEYSVTCHPEIDGTTRVPDFKADRDGGFLYVEARSSSLSDAAVARTARVGAVYDSLNKIDSPNFFLWIDVRAHGNTPLRSTALRRRLEKWLAGLNPDDYPLPPGVRREDLPWMGYEESEWKIKFWALPKDANVRGRPGVRPLGIYGGGDATYTQDDKDLREALKDKGSAYGSLRAPFVVAVALNTMSSNDEDVLSALYGSEIVERRVLPDGSSTTTCTRKPNGYWRTNAGWAHRGVSAVLVAKNLHPASVARQQHTLWEHPAPEFQVDIPSLWRKAAIEDDRVRFTDPLQSQAEWFGLSHEWPVGEPFPQ